MKFLKELYQYLVRCFPWCKKAPNALQVPNEISDNEIIVRGIVYPLFFKKKLTDNAFLPPKANGRNDVSVLRHDYTNTDFCKQHIKNNVKIGSNEYCGLAFLLAKNIHEVNNANNLILENGERVTVSIKATPLENLAMHSDILYSHGVVVDEPNTLLRKLAKSIKDKALYINDPSPNDATWSGTNVTKETLQ